MTTLDSLPPTTKQTDFEAIWHSIRTQLEEEKARLYEQIGHYPTPITGCDQQFNYLLEQQRAILQELARLDKAESESYAAADPAKMIDEFIRASPYID